MVSPRTARYWVQLACLWGRVGTRAGDPAVPRTQPDTSALGDPPMLLHLGLLRAGRTWCMGVVPGGTRDAQGTQGTAQGTAGLGFPGRVSWARQGGVPSRDGGVMGWKAPGKARGRRDRGTSGGVLGRGLRGRAGGLGRRLRYRRGVPPPPRRGGPGSAAGAARPRPNRGPARPGTARSGGAVPCRSSGCPSGHPAAGALRSSPPRSAAPLSPLQPGMAPPRG